MVNIATSVSVKDTATGDLPTFPPGSPFEEFFKDFNKRGPSSRPSTSLGSGFIIGDNVGLENTFIDSLLIQWPSGNLETHYKLKANKKYEIVEEN